MTMKLTDVKRVLRETYKENDAVFTPIQKFQVYEQVLMNLLNAGHITGAQFAKWVNVY